MRRTAVRLAVLFALLPAVAAGQAAPRVGPPRGTVIVVGGGQLGPDIYHAFIQAAGGSDALIVYIPTAAGTPPYTQDIPGAVAWRRAGAHHVVVLHTTDHAVANSDSLVSIINRAGGVWFEGGRQYRLVDAYAGTKTEAAFHAVLARGGVVGGSSAGATILGDFLVRGAPSNNNFIMDDPSHQKGFAFLRGVGIDQHVVARERLPDLADSIVPKFPKLFPMSEDEGTAWAVHGDTATIIGAGQAFAYHAQAHDPGKPFLTLHPGDVFNLATRSVMRRAADAVPGIGALADSLLGPYGNASRGGATVLAAVDGKVVVDKSYGIGPQPKYMPTTTLPLFDVGGIKGVFDSLCAQLPPVPARFTQRRGARRASAPPTPFQACVAYGVGLRAGFHRTHATAGGGVESDVDELYRLARDLAWPQTLAPRDMSGAAAAPDVNRGWRVNTIRGAKRFSAFGAPDGKRAAMERVPSRHAAVIILTNDPRADAGAMADRIMDRLLETGGGN